MSYAIRLAIRPLHLFFNYSFSTRLRRDRCLGFAGAFLLHVALFAGPGRAWVERAEYGVQTGQGGIEVDLVAAPQVLKEVRPQEVMAQLQSEDVTAPMISPAQPQQAVNTGDGSSQVSGFDAVTSAAGHGALTEARPNYLKNPAPRYPEPARRRGEEGLALLSVQVDKEGLVKDLSVSQSSGFGALDEAAVKAVQRWRFKPAHWGGLAVDSRVEVPIRFRLNEKGE